MLYQGRIIGQVWASPTLACSMSSFICTYMYVHIFHRITHIVRINYDICINPIHVQYLKFYIACISIYCHLMWLYHCQLLNTRVCLCRLGCSRRERGGLLCFWYHGDQASATPTEENYHVSRLPTSHTNTYKVSESCRLPCSYSPYNALHSTSIGYILGKCRALRGEPSRELWMWRGSKLVNDVFDTCSNDVMCKLYGWIWHGNGNNMTEHYIIKFDLLYISTVP